jgi:hypothetical protein
MKYAPGLMSAVKSERMLLRDSTVDDELYRTYGVSRPVQGRGPSQVTDLENQTDERVNLRPGAAVCHEDEEGRKEG